jgi:protein SCO1/2
MNRHAMIKPYVLAFTVALALSACQQSATPAGDPPLAGAAIGGEFTLQDKAGKPVHWADFAGKYRVVYFGYTFCPDACPTDVAVMIKGLNQFTASHPAEGAKLQPIFITIDPERDDRQAVGQFAAAFSPRLIGLTGTRAQVDQAAKAFAVYHQRGKETAGGYLMDHSRIAYLMGPNGNPIDMLPVDKGAAAVAEALAKWVK